MEPIVFWQPGEPDSETKLAEIKGWWQNLLGKPILWQQRPLPEDKDLSKINWEVLKLDEEFVPVKMDLRGITLYWQRPTDSSEHNLTPSALKLDRQAQTLDVLPDSTRNYVVRITSREPVYQVIRLFQPQVEVRGEILVFKDATTMTAVEVELTAEQKQQIITQFQ
ncbi:MAG: hypothetical protein RMK91_02100 [Pseudanabaenaceae cyanobacterium SKYGB_i_bin29]|nr:hypothetical protein [Pseudanabaenaceae cyanobacterium SKYG29]MDW8420637.1 hypothetical protein [Pseudanabaenaceae cyanobacterium SKYGB_i_bin29]